MVMARSIRRPSSASTPSLTMRWLRSSLQARTPPRQSLCTCLHKVLLRCRYTRSQRTLYDRYARLYFSPWSTSVGVPAHVPAFVHAADVACLRDCLSTCLTACLYTYAYTHACTHAYPHAYPYACRHAYTHACRHAYTHPWLLLSVEARALTTEVPNTSPNTPPKRTHQSGYYS